jgi:hypothetical protein
MINCTQYYLPREFSYVFFVAVYLPPQTGTKTKLNELWNNRQKTLNHLYFIDRDAYKALPCPPLSKFDHNSILLIPGYKKNLEVPSTSSIWKWFDASTDWNIFRDSSNGIEEFTTSVTGFINKCIDKFIPTVTVHTYPNQKPWITRKISTKNWSCRIQGSGH